MKITVVEIEARPARACVMGGLQAWPGPHSDANANHSTMMRAGTELDRRTDHSRRQLQLAS